MANYFKNTELAARYNISESTVRNWIKSAKQGKLQLELTTHTRRAYVAKSISNMPIVETLVAQNRKYRNSLATKTVMASREFFEVFNEAQVYDIVRNLELHHEIPVQYSYFKQGVEYWNEYINDQMKLDTPSILRGTIDLLSSNHGYIEQLCAKYKKINVIDIGVGNAVPVKSLLGRIIDGNKLGRYIALDFSGDVLELAQKKLRAWFGEKFPFEGYQLDFSHERFANILAEDYLTPEKDTVNLVLLLGGTATNLRSINDALRTVCESMNSRDILIYTDRLVEPAKPPEWIEFGAKQSEPWITRLLRMVFDLLNIEASFYDIEVGFDTATSQRYARTRFKVAVKVIFEFEYGRHVVSFEKGDTITLWRCWQYTPGQLTDLLTSVGFYTLHASQSADRNYILTISEVKCD